jgi:hypothetical protein
MAVAARVVIASPTDTVVQFTGLRVLIMTLACPRPTIIILLDVRDFSLERSCTLGIAILVGVRISIINSETKPGLCSISLIFGGRRYEGP